MHDLISASMGVLTINSGVGFEALIHGNPVATFGNCDYRWVTHRGNIDALDDARSYLLAYDDEKRSEAARFLWFYLHEHALSVEENHLARSRARLLDYLEVALQC